MYLSTRSLRGKAKRGISLKLQDEERERRIEYDPEESGLTPNSITVVPDTRLMLKELGMHSLA